MKTQCHTYTFHILGVNRRCQVLCCSSLGSGPTDGRDQRAGDCGLTAYCNRWLQFLATVVRVLEEAKRSHSALPGETEGGSDSR